jgi:hypothetical protein
MCADAQLIATGRSANAGRITGIDDAKEKPRRENFMRFALITGLLALATFGAIAQSTTNVVQPAFFVLKGTVQTASGVASARVINKDILAALNATGAYQFGPKATLVFVSSDDEQPPVIMVQEGRGQQTTNTDVGDFFGVTELGDAVRSADGSTRWETWNFAFNDGTTNETAFQLWGATTIQQGTTHTRRNGDGAGSQTVRSDVRGVGGLNGTNTVFSGTVVSGNSITSVGNGR